MSWSDHDTQHEIAFLERLGTWSEHPSSTRRELLESYIASIGKRKKWGKMNKKSIFEAACRFYEAFQS